NGKSLFPRQNLPGLARCAAFSPDGSRLALGMGAVDRSAAILPLMDPNNGEEMLAFDLAGSLVSQVAFSADGTRLAAAAGELTSVLGFGDAVLYVWDAGAMSPR